MNRYAHCHFCDDIRFELGNKTTLVGLYSGEMFVSEIPSVVPKLCFVVLYSSGIDNPVRSLSVRISDKDQTLIEQKVEESTLQDAFENASSRGSAEDPVQRVTLAMNLMATPFFVKKENVLTVTVIADGIEDSAGKLRIKRAKTNDKSD